VRFDRCLLLVTMLSLSVPVYADLVTFSSGAAFDLAAPGLPVETFESGLVDPGGMTPCLPPVSSSAASACFPPGGLLPGVVYNGAFGQSVKGAGRPVIGNTSKVLSATRPPLIIEFVDGVTAFGFDVYGSEFPGSQIIRVVVSSPSGVGLVDFTGSNVVGGFFFGVVSTTETIGMVRLMSKGSIHQQVSAQEQSTTSGLGRRQYRSPHRCFC